MAGYRTPLARARGLGAAKHGVGHFMTQRVTGAALVLLVGVACLHMNLGMRTIIEDYFPAALPKIALLALSLFVCWGAAAVGVFSILKVALGGGAY